MKIDHLDCAISESNQRYNSLIKKNESVYQKFETVEQ